MMWRWNWTRDWDAHHRLIAALLVALLAGAFAYEHWAKAVLWVAIWNAFALTLVSLSWVQIATADQDRLMAVANAQDVSSLVMFIFVIGTCFMSLFAVGYLLGTGRPDDRPMEVIHTFVSIATVGSSWLLIHTLFALHYAHLYHGRGKHSRGGIAFPDTTDPNYFDFAYLSFNIGTGFQSGDVKVISRSLRKIVMLQGLIAFVFNTVIVSLGVGCVATLVIG